MAAESSSLFTRPEGHWLSRGLIAYGIVGLMVAATGFGATLWVNGRISELHSEARVTLARAATSMELAASVLLGASSTAQSFSGTAGQTAQAVSSAVLTTTEVRSDLSALEAQLRSVSFLGATPLASSADAVGRIVASMEGLDTQLSLVAGRLEDNRDALAGNGSSLSTLATSTRALAARLGPSVGQDSFADVQQVIAITLLMFSAWSIVPGAGALVLGLWLRRELRRSRSA